jgi:hypothetical protein
MSLARQTRDHVLSIISASAPAEGGGFTPDRSHEDEGPYTPAATIAAQQIMMRLAHDLRQLKDTKAIDRKIAAKRLMLPEYDPWVEGQLAAGRATEARELPVTGANDVLPTMMVWAIDTGNWPRALELAEHVLRFDVALPSRYERDAATLIVEEIADAAIKIQNRGQPFPLDVLEYVQELTADIDMHDQPRAKLAKAIGAELVAASDATESGPLGATFLSMKALEKLREAQHLNPRAGVTGQIKRLEKALGAAASATEQAGTPPAA